MIFSSPTSRLAIGGCKVWVFARNNSTELFHRHEALGSNLSQCTTKMEGIPHVRINEEFKILKGLCLGSPLEGSQDLQS